jgi:hypothetical protein
MLCLSLCQTCFAGRPDTASYEYRYRLFGVGFKQQQISYLSPLYYEGVSLIPETLGRTSFRSGTLTSSISDVFLDYFPNLHNNSYIMSIGGDYMYSRYYLLQKSVDYDTKTSSNLFIGWGYWCDYQVATKPDNTNNVLYYHFNNMGCLNVALSGKVGPVYLLNEFAIPLVGIYFGSQYSGQLPYFVTEEDANFFDDVDILFINKNLHFKNTLSADFKLKFSQRSTTIRLQYTLSGRTLRLNNNDLSNSCHLFKIGYLFNETSYAHK